MKSGRRGRVPDGEPPLTGRERDDLLKVERQLAAAVQELARSLRESARDRVDSYSDEVLFVLRAVSELKGATEGLARLEILMARRGSEDAWPMSWPELGLPLGMSKQRVWDRYRQLVTEPDIPGLIADLEGRSRRMQTLAGKLRETVTKGRMQHRREVAEARERYDAERREYRARDRSPIVWDPESDNDPWVLAERADMAKRGLMHPKEMKRLGLLPPEALEDDDE